MHQPYPPRPPHQPPQRPRRLTDRKGFKFGCLPAIVIVWLLIIGAVLTHDSDDDTKASHTATPSAAPAKSKKPRPTSTGLSKERMTDITVDLVWDSYSSERRDLLCAGIGVYGPDWFADQMHSDNIDPDRAAKRVKEKCESR